MTKGEIEMKRDSSREREIPTTTRVIDARKESERPETVVVEKSGGRVREKTCK